MVLIVGARAGLLRTAQNIGSRFAYVLHMAQSSACSGNETQSRNTNYPAIFGTCHTPWQIVFKCSPFAHAVHRGASKDVQASTLIYKSGRPTCVLKSIFQQTPRTYINFHMTFSCHSKIGSSLSSCNYPVQGGFFGPSLSATTMSGYDV